MRSLFAASLLLLAGCGHVAGGFDFRDPPCTAHLDTDATKVEVRYLGSGGVYVRWRDEAILVGPQWSNPSLLRAAFGRSSFDETRIENALRELGSAEVRAILIGHSHYDHIGDVPVVAKQPHIENARIYVNAIGDKLLRAYPELQPRTTIMHAGDAFELSPSFRVRVIASDHAPQICRGHFWPCVYGAGPVPEAWDTEWKKHYLRDFRGGETFAFDIEVRDGATTRFRIYYNDASATTPLGQTTGDFDLAVLTMAQWNFVRDYPRDLLAVLRPRHVLASHWDDFFRRDGRYPFVANLSNASAERFLAIVEQHTSGTVKPANDVCGLKNDHSTMAIPRSSLLFEPRPNEKTLSRGAQPAVVEE